MYLFLGNRRQQRRSDYKKDNYKDNYKDNINKWSGTSAGTPAGSRKAYNSAFDPRVRICKRELMHVSFRDLKWQVSGAAEKQRGWILVVQLPKTLISVDLRALEQGPIPQNMRGYLDNCDSVSDSLSLMAPRPCF